MPCPCDGIQGLDLLVCLAPPPGEYEAQIQVSDNISITINEKGVFIKRIIYDDNLPFIKTIYRKINLIETLSAYGISYDTALCETARSLLVAASHGSLSAKRKIDQCKELIDKIITGCSI